MGKHDEKRYLIVLAAAVMLILAINVIKAQVGQQQPRPSISCQFNTDNIIIGNVEGFYENCFKDMKAVCANGKCSFYEQGKLRAKCSLIDGKLDCYV